MIRKIVVLITFLILSVSYAANPIVVIDAGHGGKDPGAVNGRYEEKTYNLDIALKVRDILKQRNITVFMTRETDVFLNLSDIPRVAVNNKANMFVSIHNNSINDASMKGCMVLYCDSKDSGNKIRNKRIAEIIQTSLIKNTTLKDRGVVLRRNLAVLNGINKIPGVLVEVAFISNLEDLGLLNEDAFRKKAALAISDGIIQSLGELGFSVDNESPITDRNTCTTCGIKLNPNWKPDGLGNHYKECNNGHREQLGAHYDENVDAICDICKLAVDTCYSCKAKLKPNWEYNELGKHYKICENNHCSYIENHKFVSGKCNVCGFIENEDSNDNKKSVCSTCAEQVLDEWKDDLKGNHYKECTNTHENLIGEHYDANEDLKCEVCNLEINFCYSCKAKLKPAWVYDDLGQHYRVCENEHCSYIAKHTMQNGKCTVCQYESNTNDTIPVKGTLFSDLPDDHWAYSEVKAMVEVGIVNGREDGTLGTNDYITVEECISILSKLVEKKGLNKADGTVYLQDKTTGWSKDGYISLMQVIGAKSGEDSEQLGKKEIQLLLGNKEEEIIKNYKLPITREKIANLMGIFVEDGTENLNNVLKAKDWSNVESIYRSRINELAERNIFRGANECGEIYIHPKNNIKRVEAIALVNRLYNDSFESKNKKETYYIHEKDINIPILLYHEFYKTEPEKEKYIVVSTPEKFEKDMLEVLDKGYTFVSINDIIDYAKGEKALPEKSVALTFDDGYESNYTYIYPILKKHNIPATIFVVDKFVGKGNYFNWDEAKEMINSGLVTIGSHGHDHEYMTQLDIEEFKEKTSATLSTLKEKLGKQKYVLYAYPHGDNNEKTNTVLKELGVDMYMSTISGVNTKKDLASGLLKRNTSSYVYMGFDF